MPRPTTQRALTTMARLLAVGALLPMLASKWGSFWDAPRHTCADGIEIIEQGQPPRIGCIEELVAFGCKSPLPGDRVHLGEAAKQASGAPLACHIEPDGMRAAWMLAWGLPLDVNRRSAEDLAYIPGIGTAMAERIVEHRNRHGAYVDLNALTKISGLKQRRLQQLQPYLTVGGRA